MLRGKLKFQLLFLFVTLFALFVVNNTMAQQCLAPECFPAEGCNITVYRGTQGEYPIIIENVNDPDYATFASNIDSSDLNKLGPFPWAVFAYSISDCRYSSIEQALPASENVCGNNPFYVAWYPPETSSSDPGEGGINGWYINDDTVQVSTWPSNISANLKGFYYIASGNVGVSARPIRFKAGNNILTSSILAPDCQGEVPSLQFTKKGFTAVDAAGNIFDVLLTFTQRGELLKVEHDKNNSGDYETATLRNQEEVFSCIPRSLFSQATCPSEAETVQLPLISGGDADHCCQRVTATAPGVPTTYKSGQQTSCPMFINGRYTDYCAGIY